MHILMQAALTLAPLSALLRKTARAATFRGVHAVYLEVGICLAFWVYAFLLTPRPACCPGTFPTPGNL